jgi:hypothetical protein
VQLGLRDDRPVPRADLPKSAGPIAGASWLEELGRRLPRHAEVLRRLIDGARVDPRIVQFSVGCSVARGAGDELSDLDCELSLEPDAWPSGLELIEPLVRTAGDVVELLHHQWPPSGATEHRRTAVQYADGIQLDLMVWPVSVWSGMHPPDTVVLHSTRDIFTLPWDGARARPTLERLHEWSFLGWWALLDADKYLRRGSLWEARQRVEEARTAVWQLSAAAHGLPFPEYGITALLDAAEPCLPAGVEATATGVDPVALRAAVERCAHLLYAQWARAVAAVGPAVDPRSQQLALWALERLGVEHPDVRAVAPRHDDA